MKAFYCVTSTTDLVRTNLPARINDTERELFSDSKDFLLDCAIRTMGIRQRYPNAEVITTNNGMLVYVDGVMVFDKHILYIEPGFVDIPDEDECED